MRKLLSTVVLIAIIAAALQWFHKPLGAQARAEPYTLTCDIKKELPVNGLTPESMYAAAVQIARENLFLAETPMRKRLADMSATVCNAAYPVEVRSLTYDYLLENASIYKVLESQRNLERNWVSSVTGQVGTVYIIETVRENGQRCNIVEYPSKMPFQEAAIIIAEREKYCHDGDDWISVEDLGTWGFSFEDDRFVPKGHDI